MQSLISRLLPEAIKNLIPYQSARRIGGNGHLFLNANELECKLAYDRDTQGFHRYPDFKPQQLAEAYQDYCQTEADCLAVRGADEAIDLIVRTFCSPGQDAVLICPPTYGMYEICANSFSVGVHSVPLDDNFQLDYPGIQTKLSGSKVIFLCSPSNPTGNLLQRGDIEQLLEETRDSHLVVVDEAYIEFSSADTVMPLLAQYPNLVVIRTLSKAFGLAAIRCGFVLGNQDIIDGLRKLIAPYPMPDPTADISLTALESKNIAVMQANVDDLNRTKAWFSTELKKLDTVAQVYPSFTNFVLIRFNSAVDAYAFLLEKGIVTRNQQHEAALKNCVRITIGSRASMNETLAALKQLM